MSIDEKALDILNVYNGTNDYILWLCRQVGVDEFKMSRDQSKYVVDNFSCTPALINKYVPIHPYSATRFQEQYKLAAPPTHILIYKVLSRKGDDLHIWGAFEEFPKYHTSIWVNKRAFKKIKEVGELDFSVFSREPKPHQIPGVKALLANDKFILADEMGVGKSSQAIMAAVLGRFKKILVVCPASLKLNWRIEIGYCDDINNVSIIEGSNYHNNSKWTIINYDILKNHHHTPGKGIDTSKLIPSNIDLSKFDLVIADECQKLSNSQSGRAKIFKDFSARIPTRWLLTGTPISNKPMDFFSLLDLCESPLATNWQSFVIRYCKGFQVKNKATGKSFWKVTGASNLDELRNYTCDLILRRTKAELNLPPKTTKASYIPLEDSNGYNQFIDEYDQWVRDMKEQEIELPMTAHLAKLTAVRQLLSKDKVKSTIDLAEDYIEQGHKVIIFSCFTDTIVSIHDHFKKTSVLVNGATNLKNRQAAVDAFQNNDKITVFCGNIIAAGVGLTLLKGTVLIFNDLDWVPSNHAQASNRSHRLGQKNEVHVIYQLVVDTIDITMFEMLQKKMDVIGTILGDGASDEFSVGKEVLKSLKKKR